MLKFRQFITEKKISASGFSAQRHFEKYIKPHLGKKSTHKVNVATKNFAKDDVVSIDKHKVIDGVHHVTISRGKKNEQVPISKIIPAKYEAPRNKGFENEGKLADLLIKEGLMKGERAGFGAGVDFHLIDKRKKDAYIGGSEEKFKEEPKAIRMGEHKLNTTAAFGQLTISRDPKTGKFRIADKDRKRRPEFAKHIEKAVITHKGQRKRLLDHLNDTEPKGTVNKTGFHSDEQDLAPLHAYMRDHGKEDQAKGIDILHIDSHGTYLAGDSEKKDRHGLGFPVFKGQGRFRVRQKTDNPNSRTVSFHFLGRKTPKSKVHIVNNEQQRKELKYLLGHEVHPSQRKINNEAPGCGKEFYSKEEYKHLHGDKSK